LLLANLTEIPAVHVENLAEAHGQMELIVECHLTFDMFEHGVGDA